MAAMQTAIKKLGEVDSSLHVRLTQDGRYDFWYHRRDAREDRFNRVFTVPEAYLRWADEGLISRVVFCVFLTEILQHEIFSLMETRLRYRKVYSRTVAWLIKHEFPAELVESYEQADIAMSKFTGFQDEDESAPRRER